LTKPIPDFDIEKRRRWYAICFGASGASSVLGVLLITEDLGQLNESFWDVSLILFAFWLFFFIFKFVAGYAIWYRPYSTRRRAIAFSVLAALSVYIALTGATVLFLAMKDLGSDVGLFFLLKSFVTVNQSLYGAPYIAAAIVGWTFARPMPDVREQF